MHAPLQRSVHKEVVLAIPARPLRSASSLQLPDLWAATERSTPLSGQGILQQEATHVEFLEHLPGPGSLKCRPKWWRIIVFVLCSEAASAGQLLAWNFGWDYCCYIANWTYPSRLPSVFQQ